MKWVGSWARKSRNSERRFVAWKFRHARPVLIASTSPLLTDVQRQALDAIADSVCASDFSLLHSPIPTLDTCDFSADWRFNKRWPPAYFGSYSFYDTEKDEAFDVKMPWELSRLHYLVPVLARQWAGEADLTELRWLLRLLQRWRSENPLAYSVNWNAMEASMRVVSLVILSDFIFLLRAREDRDGCNNVLDKLAPLILIIIEEHGTFIWKNREFTDVRGNHFTANLTGLLLASLTLEANGSPRRAWREYALRWQDREIILQFFHDGVNFEKACGYHKLVLELFTLAAIARQRAERPFGKEAIARLAAAARFSDAVTRPDGWGANFGDTDDAVALPFLFDRPRSHGAAVELVRAFLGEGIGTVSFPEEEKMAALFLVGKALPSPAVPPVPETIAFLEGGYVVVRTQDTGFFFMADFGEVGMHGRGGHGHNDLLSFELCIDGRPTIIDPGCPSYTADLAVKSAYRKTGVHATIELFDDEMARLVGPWTIRNDAHPLGVFVESESDRVVVRAAHDGYERISPGTRVKRSFTVYPSLGELCIRDEIITTVDGVPARWRFPVGAGEVASGVEGIRIGGGVIAQSDMLLTAMPSTYSDGYGHEAHGTSISAQCVLSKGRTIHQFNFHSENGRN